jgi:hypothetical protein
MRSVEVCAAFFALGACRTATGAAPFPSLSVDASDASGGFQPAPPDPNAPVRACTEGAIGDPGMCPLIALGCADASLLEYYGNGRCVSGRCSWQKGTVDCTTANGTCVDSVNVDEAGADADIFFVGLTDAGGGCMVHLPPEPDPPPVACGAEAGDDAGPCPLPPSTCGDSQWLVYYDDGQCVAGQCVWQKRHRGCGGGGCFKGACAPPAGGTLVAPN